MEQQKEITVHQKQTALSLQLLQQYKTQLLSEIEGFDETDIKTLQSSIGQKFLQENINSKLPELIARIGVITGIFIPSGNVFLLLQKEIENTIRSDHRYSNLTYNDFVQAFTMAANSDFGAIEDYGKALNIKYFRTVVNSYLSHRSKIMMQYDDWKFMHDNRLKIDYNKSIDYRPIVERCYQDYLKEKFNPYLWPIQCYDLLVTEGLIPAEQYKHFLKKAKSVLIAQLNAEIMKNERSQKKVEKVRYEGREKNYEATRDGYQVVKSKDGLPLDLGANIQSMMDRQKVDNGESDQLIISRAKQLCLVKYFRQMAIEGKENIYVERKVERSS